MYRGGKYSKLIVQDEDKYQDDNNQQAELDGGANLD